MRFNQWMACITTGLMLSGNSLFAQNPPTHEQLQVPQCLAAKITSPHTVLAENKQFKIINVPSGDLEQLLLLADHVKCGHFVNVSHKIKSDVLATQKQSANAFLHKKIRGYSKSLAAKPPVYEIKHQDEVNECCC